MPLIVFWWVFVMMFCLYNTVINCVAKWSRSARQIEGCIVLGTTMNVFAVPRWLAALLISELSWKYNETGFYRFELVLWVKGVFFGWKSTLMIIYTARWGRSWSCAAVCLLEKSCFKSSASGVLTDGKLEKCTSKYGNVKGQFMSLVGDLLVLRPHSCLVVPLPVLLSLKSLKDRQHPDSWNCYSGCVAVKLCDRPSL